MDRFLYAVLNKKRFWVALVIFLLVALPSMVNAAQVRFTWTLPTTAAADLNCPATPTTTPLTVSLVTLLEWGTQSGGPYPNVVEVPTGVTEAFIDSPFPITQGGTIYARARVQTPTGVYSCYTSERSAVIPPFQIPLPPGPLDATVVGSP